MAKHQLSADAALRAQGIGLRMESLNLFGEVEAQRERDLERERQREEEDRILAQPGVPAMGSWVIARQSWTDNGKRKVSEKGWLMKVTGRYATASGKVRLSLDADGAYWGGTLLEDVEPFEGDPFEPEPGTEHVALPPGNLDLSMGTSGMFGGPLCVKAYRRGYVDFERGQPYDADGRSEAYTARDAYRKGWMAAGGEDPWEMLRRKNREAGKVERRATAAEQKRAKLLADAAAAKAPTPEVAAGTPEAASETPEVAVQT
jgi:hypothetical protein